LKISSKTAGVALIVVAAGVSVLGYLAFYPPLEFKITSAKYAPVDVKGITFYELVYGVSYTNLGIFDLTISGEIQTRIEGIRDIDARAVFNERLRKQPRFLLRRGEMSSYVISVGIVDSIISEPKSGAKIHLEAIAFLNINGMQRTLTASHQFTKP